MSDVYDPDKVARGMTQDAATNRLQDVSSVAPGTAATALQAERSGSPLPASSTMFNPAAAAAALKKQQDAAAVQDPAVAHWAATAPPAHVAAAQDALPGLANVAAKVRDYINAPWQNLAQQAHALASSPTEGADAWVSKILGWAGLGVQTGQTLLAQAQGPTGAAQQFSQAQASDKEMTQFASWLVDTTGRAQPSSSQDFLDLQAKAAANGVSPRDEAINEVKGLINLGLMLGGGHEGAVTAAPEEAAGLRPMGPGEFGTAREAAMASRKMGPAEPGYEWKVELGQEGYYRPVQTPTGYMPEAPPSGVSTPVDAARSIEADLHATSVKEMEAAVAELPTHENNPEVTRGFLESIPELQGKQATIADTGAFVTAIQKHATAVFEALGLDSASAFWAAHQAGAAFQMPMSDYLAAMSGKPWEDEVRKITSFSRDGVSQADAKELWKPEQITAPDEPGSMLDFNVVAPKTQGNAPGAWAEDSESGNRFLIKGQNPPNPEIARNEYLANLVMKHLGLPTPNIYLVNLEGMFGGGLGTASREISNLIPGNELHPQDFPEFQKQFAAHVLLANRDVIGLPGEENIGLGDKGIVNFDLGGALRYRGMGQPKTDFTGDPTEWESMRSAKYPQVHKWFGNMTPEQLEESAATLKSLDPETIKELVHRSGVADPQDMIDTLVARRKAILEKVGLSTEPAVYVPPAIETDSDLSGPENEALRLQAPAIAAAAKQATQALYLSGLFKDGKALGMSDTDMKLWGQKLEAAQKQVYDKLLDAMKKKIKAFRESQWKNAYASQYTIVSSEFTSRPEVMARIQLTSSATQATDLVKDNALVKDGKPITFYRITNYHDTGDGEVPLDLFANPRPVASPHPYWVQTQAHAHWNNGISFGENPYYAQESATHGTGPEAYSSGYGGFEKRPVMWVVNIKSNKVGDFRNLDDVEKAVDWYKKTNPQQSYESDYDFNHRVKDKRSQLTSGYYGPWEVPEMLRAIGWDTVRIVEDSQMRDQPNLFTINPGAVYWKFDPGLVPKSIRLSLANRDLVPKELLSRLPKGIWAKDGQDIDAFAEAMGFNSGQEMLEKIAETETLRGEMPFKDWLERQIKAESALRAKDALGWDFSREGILEEAKAAVAATKLEDLLFDSLQNLQKQLGGTPLDKEAIKNQAISSWRKLPVAEATNVRAWEGAIRRNSKAVEQALLRKSPTRLIEAFKHRQDMVMNYYRLTEAHTELKRWQTFQKKLQSWSKNDLTEKVDPDFVNQIHGLLAQVGFKIEHDTTHLIQKMQETPWSDFQSFWNDRGTDLEDDPLPRNFYGNVLQDLSKAKVDDFESYFNTLQQLDHIGRKIKAGKDLSEKFELKEKALEAGGNLRKRPPNITYLEREHPTTPQTLSHWLREVDSWLLKMEQMFIDLDMRNPNGPFNKVVVLPLETRKNWADDAHREIAAHFHDLKGKLDKNFGRWLKTRVSIMNEFPEFIDRNGDPYIGTNSDIVGLALHTGSRSNWSVLMDSWPQPIPGMRIQALLDRYMTKDAWTYTQGMWDAFQKFKPALFDMYDRINGIPMTNVPSQPFTNEHGRWDGGYYPISRSPLGLPKNYVNPDTFMGQTEYYRARPANPHAKERTGSRAPLDLKLAHGRARLEQMIHDLAYREVLMQVDKFIGDDDLKADIIKHYGPEYYGRMTDLIRKVAGAAGFNSDQSEVILNLIEGANRNAVLDLVGYSTQTVAKHFVSALGDTVATVGKGETLGAYRYMFTHWEDFWNFVLTNSPEVRNRVMNVSETARESYLAMVEQRGWLSALQRNAFDWVAASDQISAAPAWWATYWKYVADPTVSHEEASALADQQVRQAHGASSMVDSAPFLRLGRENSIPAAVYKSGTQLMNFFSHKWNRAREIPQDLFGVGGYTRDIPRGLNNLILILGVSAIVEKEVSEWYGAQIKSWLDALTHIPLSGLPWANDIVGALEGRDVSNASMMIEGPKEGSRVVKDISQMTKGEEPRHPIEDVANTLGFGFGLPGKQFGNTAQFLSDFITGREENVHNPVDFFHGLVTGPQGLVPPKERGQTPHGRTLSRSLR